jgi:HSP20 family protein
MITAVGADTNLGEEIMAETAAVRRAEEPVKPTKYGSVLDQIQETFNALSRRAYEIFENNGRTAGSDLENWFRAESELLHPVHLTVEEFDDSFAVKAEVPGFNEKELEISIEPRRLTIIGKRENKREEKKGKTVYSEKCCDEIWRSVELPADVETDKVNATLKNGVLEFTLPKIAKAHTIQVHPKAA